MNIRMTESVTPTGWGKGWKADRHRSYKENTIHAWTQILPTKGLVPAPGNIKTLLLKIQQGQRGGTFSGNKSRQ